MRNFKNIIRKKEAFKAIGFSIIIAVLLFASISSGVKYNEILKKEYTINNISDLSKYQENSSYVNIKTNAVYSTKYGFFIDNKQVAEFVDIDIEGASLIALVPIDEAKKILEDNGQIKEIKGKLGEFTDIEYINAYKEIQADYVKQFKDDMTEEQVMNSFMPIQLDAYTGKRIDNIINASIFGIPIAIFLVLVCISVAKIINPNLDKLFKKSKYLNEVGELDIEDAQREYFNNDYIYKAKNLVITNKYIITSTMFSFKVNKISNIGWVYERSVKQYGAFEVNRFLEIVFEDKKQWSISSKNAENLKIMDLLKEKEPSIEVGYTIELRDKWRKGK